MIALSSYKVFVMTWFSDIWQWTNWHMWLYMWHLRGILVLGMYVPITFPTTWSWWCYQWHYCICHVEMVVYRHYITFFASASPGAAIGVMCHWYRDADDNSITWQSIHVAFYLDHFDQSNTVLALMTLSASLDASASGNGITWPKGSSYI